LVLPPLLRLLYLATILTLLFISIAWLLGQIGIVVPSYHLYVADYLVSLVYAYPRRTWLCAFGFITGGAAHSIADWLATGGKRFLRRVGLRVPKNNAGDRY